VICIKHKSPYEIVPKLTREKQRGIGRCEEAIMEARSCFRLPAGGIPMPGRQRTIGDEAGEDSRGMTPGFIIQRREKTHP
jgi:hypothetical protein